MCAFAAGMRTDLDQLFLTCFVLSGLFVEYCVALDVDVDGGRREEE